MAPTLRFCLYFCSAWARRSLCVGSAAMEPEPSAALVMLVAPEVPGAPCMLMPATALGGRL